jgi:hypothetical protein
MTKTTDAFHEYLHTATKVHPGNCHEGTKEEQKCPSCRRLSRAQGRPWRVQKILAPAVIRSPNRPTRSESLRRTRFAGPQHEYIHTLHNFDGLFSVRYLLRPKTPLFIQSVSLITSLSFRKYDLRYARRVGRELHHVFCALALKNCSAVLWFTQRQKVVSAFEKFLPLQAFLTCTLENTYVSCRKNAARSSLENAPRQLRCTKTIYRTARKCPVLRSELVKKYSHVSWLIQCLH